MSDFDIFDMTPSPEDVPDVSRRIVHAPTVIPSCTNLQRWGADADAFRWGFYADEPRSTSTRPRLIVTPECLVGEGMANLVRLFKVLATCDAPRRATA